MARPGSAADTLAKSAQKPIRTVVGDYDYATFREHERAEDYPDHLPSRYKTPYHITFSDDSIYADEGAGKWRMKNDKWHFKPGKTNLRYFTREEIRDYFRRNEPDAVLED